MKYFVRIDYIIRTTPVMHRRFLCFDFDEFVIEVKSLLQLGAHIMSIKFERTF